MYRGSVFGARIDETLGSKQQALVLGFLVAAIVVAGLLLTARPAHAATFTVNRTSDAKDRNINNSVCDVSRKKGQQCTLRAAIQEANNTPGADVINFNIGGTTPVKTISPASELPPITEKVTIDGYTQPGTSPTIRIELNGTNAGAGANGLTIKASDSVVKGLVINRFSNDGVLIKPDPGGSATGNKIQGNYIGTNAAGTDASANGGNGVEIAGDGSSPNNVHGNTIGGTSAGEGNVISGNGGSGVVVRFAEGTLIQGNRIGTRADGTTNFLGNHIGVGLDNAIDTEVGGTGAGNTIASSTLDGVSVNGGFKNSILSNSIFSISTSFFPGKLGIDLLPDGRTTNDYGTPPDADSGTNGLQNFPELTSATVTNGPPKVGNIKGTLRSTPSTTFKVQFFSNDNGTADGMRFVTEKSVTTDSNGSATFDFTLSNPAMFQGDWVTATATDPDGNTSEFSDHVAVPF